jgi:hypothetical protein
MIAGAVVHPFPRKSHALITCCVRGDLKIASATRGMDYDISRKWARGDDLHYVQPSELD